MPELPRPTPAAGPRPEVHLAAWTPDRIAAFWDNYGSIPHFRARFFALAWSEGILELVSRFVPDGGTILDYGCGRGDLLEVLLRRGRACMGCDSSPENVRATGERLGSHPGFLGAFLPRPLLPARPDLVTLVEVVEHLPAAAAAGLVAEIAGLLPAGGHIVITCPNQEDLARAEVLCPECGCRFHPVQHLQSLGAEDLCRLGEAAGFERAVARATRFRKSGEPRPLAWLYARWYQLFGKPPHLVYIGRKR